MKVTVDRWLCVGCLRCQHILTPELGRQELDHNGIPVPEMDMMPQLAYNGWEIRRELSQDEIDAIREVVADCEGQALEFEE